MPKIVDADQRRSELAAAAARVIARSGIDAASMREIAAEAGWTTGTLVHYFADKHELLDFTLRASIERRSAQRSERTEIAPVDALRSTLTSALPTDDDTRVHWIVTVTLAGAAASDDALAATQREAYRGYRAYLMELLAAIPSVDDTRVEDTRIDDTRVDDIQLEDIRVDGTRVEDTRIEDTRIDDTRIDDIQLEAERLIGLVDGIALQALFDPTSWPADRQLRALDAGLRTASLMP